MAKDMAGNKIPKGYQKPIRGGFAPCFLPEPERRSGMSNLQSAMERLDRAFTQAQNALFDVDSLLATAAPEISEAMVERAAKAICYEWGYLWDAPQDDDQSTGTGELGDERPSKKLYREAASAALAAAREKVLPGHSGNYAGDTPLDITGDLFLGHIQVKMVLDGVTGKKKLHWRHAEGRDLSDDDGWLLADLKEAKDD